MSLNLTEFFCGFEPLRAREGGYPDLSGPTTKKKTFFMCLFPKFSIFNKFINNHLPLLYEKLRLVSVSYSYL